MEAGPKITRRNFLEQVGEVLEDSAKGSLAIAALTKLMGCRAVNEAAAPPPPRPVEAPHRAREIAHLLRERYGAEAVQEVVARGDKTVIYLPDQHNATIENFHYRRILELEELLDLKLVGLENRINGPRETDHKWQAAEREFKSLIAFDQRRSFNPGNSYRLTERYNPYDKFFADSRFETIGLESYPMTIELLLLKYAEQVLKDFAEEGEEIVRSRELDEIILRKGPHYDSNILEYWKIQHYFRDDPLFPKLSLSGFSKRKVGGLEGRAMDPYKKTDVSYLAQLRERLEVFIRVRAHCPRNEIGVTAFAKRMKERDYDVGAILFGNWHSIRYRDCRTPVQDWLGVHGFSSMVLSPV